MMFIDDHKEHNDLQVQEVSTEPATQTLPNTLAQRPDVVPVQELVERIPAYQFANDLSLAQEIVIQPLPETTIQAVRSVVAQLRELAGLIGYRQRCVHEASEDMKERIKDLSEVGKLTVNKEEYVRSEHSVHQYIGLLGDIGHDVLREIKHLEFCLQPDQERSSILVEPRDVAAYPEFVLTRVGYVRRYLKRISKDLDVSYSRYAYGFSQQFSQLQNVAFAMLMKHRNQAAPTGSQEVTKASSHHQHQHPHESAQAV